MKGLGIWFGTLFLGFVVTAVMSRIFSSGNPDVGSSYLGMIGISILYLASVIAVCTYLILKSDRNY